MQVQLANGTIQAPMKLEILVCHLVAHQAGALRVNVKDFSSGRP